MEDLLNDQISLRPIDFPVGLDQFLLADASVLVLVEEVELPPKPGLLFGQFYEIGDVVNDYDLELVLCVEDLQSFQSFLEVDFILFLLLTSVEKYPRVLQCLLSR